MKKYYNNKEGKAIIKLIYNKSKKIARFYKKGNKKWIFQFKGKNIELKDVKLK